MPVGTRRVLLPMEKRGRRCNWSPPGAPPELGSHTAEIMTEPGFAAADIESVLSHCESEMQETYTALFAED